MIRVIRGGMTIKAIPGEGAISGSMDMEAVALTMEGDHQEGER